MTRLPVELIDEILALADDLGTIKASEVSRICTRWRCFQRLLFKSIPLDPFELEHDVLDLTLPQHRHLTSYIEEIHIVPRPASCDLPHDHKKDLSPSFTNFLGSLTNPRGIIFHDACVKWTSLSTSSRNSLLAVFQCSSFRSLEVNLTKPLPSWMLSSASILTIRCVGLYMLPPLIEGPIPDRCSLTHLVLATHATIQMMAAFCVQQPDSAKVLFRQLDHLCLEYFEVPYEFAIAPFVEDLIVSLGPQLKVLDLDIEICRTSLPLSASVFCHLGSLQELNIRLIGYLPGNGTLQSAENYIPSFLDLWPVSSPITSLSLGVEEVTPVNEGSDTPYTCRYQNLLRRTHQQLSSDKWRYLASASILVDVQDGSGESDKTDGVIRTGDNTLELKTLLRVNNPRIVAAVPRIQ